MEKLNELEALAKQCTSMKVDVNTDAAYANFITQIEPEHIIDISEHVRELEQRAEAAEAKLAELDKQEAIFQVEVSGNHWLNAGPVDDSDFTGLPDGVNLLYARPVPAVNLADLVPDGWKLVPIEPTKRMIIDGFESEPSEFWNTPEEWESYQAMSGCGQAAHKTRLCWTAMLAAAPEVE